jgi:transposase
MVDFWSAQGEEQSEWMRGYRLEWGEVVGLRVRRLRNARDWTLQNLRERVRKPDGGHYDVTAEQRVVLDVIERRGLSADEAIARLAIGARPSED